MLTLSHPLSRPLDLPVCLARFPSARLWLKDESLEDSATLPDPDLIAAEIVEDLEAALQQFAAIANDLKGSKRERSSRLRVRSPYFDASHRPSRLFRLCRNGVLRGASSAS